MRPFFLVLISLSIPLLAISCASTPEKKSDAATVAAAAKPTPSPTPTPLATVPATAGTIDKLEASVNNQLVLHSDIKRFRATATLRLQLDPIFAGTDLAKNAKTAPDSDVREYLIQERLILQAFPMTDAEVETEINSIQASNKISREQLRSALLAQGFAFPDYFELIRIGAAKRNLLDREIRTKVSLSEDDLHAFYATKYAKDKSVETFFHVLLISNGNKKAVQTAEAELRKGGEFSELAKKYSTDSSSEAGGDLGTLNSAQMNKNLRDEIMKLKSGEISPVIEVNKSSFMLVKLVSLTASNEAHFKKVENELRGELSNIEFQKQLEIWTNRQKQTSFVHRAGDPSVAQSLK